MRDFACRHRLTAAILTLALVLRLVNLGTRPLWYDEAFAVLYAEKAPVKILSGTIPPTQGAAAADVHPLLYYLGLHVWVEAVGSSPFAVRLPSALMGVATVWVIGLLGRAAAGKKLGQTAMLLAAIAPFPIAYSQEARMYSLLALCAVGATYAAWRGVGPLPDQPAASGGARGAAVWWLLYALCAALTMYSHTLGALTLLALNLLLLVHLARPWQPGRFWLWLAANLGALMLYSPWLIRVLPGQLYFVRQGYWVTRPKLTELVRSLIVYQFNLPLPAWSLPWALAGTLLLLVLLAYRAIRMRARIPAAFTWLSLAPLAFMWLISQWQPVFIERAVLPAACLYWVAVGWLLIAGKLPRGLQVVLCAHCLLIAGVSLVYYYSYADFPRAPFQEATVYLRANVEPGDAVVHSNKLTYFPMYVYDRQTESNWIADPAGDGSDTLARPAQEALGLFPAPDMATAVGDAERVWLIIFDQAIDEWGGRHPHLAWLETRYRLAHIQHFRQLQVRCYGKIE